MAMNYLNELNEKQYEAVTANDRYLRIIAGAGSGKTRVLTTKLAYLVNEEEVNPYNILAITFTNKAAKEMKERAFKMLGSDAYKMQISTFHSLGLLLIRENYDKLGFDKIFVQVKHWNSDHLVGRPDIQAFVGAIAGKGGKGLFVTTSSFTSHAVEYARNQHIVLIDGIKLANLMIEHNFGVTVKQVFQIKALDTDVFEEYLES